MSEPDHEREKPGNPVPEIPEHLVERFAPLSRDPVIVFGGHLLQIVGAITILFVIFHFVEKYW
jgi:hypothetical protein